MTKEKAEDLFNYWLRILGIENWDIVFDWAVRKSNMVLEDTYGTCTYNREIQSAMIQIMDELDIGATDTLAHFDYEVVLVHELLHIKFAWADNPANDLEKALTHSLIQELAKSFVQTRRTPN